MSDGKQRPPQGARDTPSGEGAVSGSVVYELCNVFDTPTGRRIELGDGDPLPNAPKGWSWRRLPP